MSTTPTPKDNEQQAEIPIEQTPSQKLLQELISSFDPNDPLLTNESLKQFIREQKENNPFNGKLSIMDKIPTYDWERISYEFDVIYGEYTDEMKDAIEEFYKLDMERLMWLEAAHKIDADRSTRRINATETWVLNAEGYLETLRQELLSSVKVIKTTLNKLDVSKPSGDVGPSENVI